MTDRPGRWNFDDKGGYLAQKPAEMNDQEHQVYFDKVNEIGDKVYELYNQSDREDLIMLYSMKEDQIYAYRYDDFFASLNERSKAMLISQFEEAKALNKLVLFIQDEKRAKLKSFTI